MSSLRAYCTLPYLRQRQGLNLSDTSDDSKLLAKIRAATQDIERETGGRVFEPVQETRTFDWQDALTLFFRNQDLLQITSVTDGAGATIAPSSFIMLGGSQSGNGAYGPFYGMKLNPTQAYFLYITTPIRAISVVGVWGWHDDYANAWHDSGVTVQDNPLTSGATTITTSANNNTISDAWGQTFPQDGPVQAGHLIQVESEWMQVVKVPTSTSLQVVRGVNGTTAASHAQGKAITIYEPPYDIKEACATLGAYLYVSDSANFTKTVMPAMGQTIIPNQYPASVTKTLALYYKRRVS